eukprot:scaffold6242_cov168-Amphora_coffeaeformis.AAC.2
MKISSAAITLATVATLFLVEPVSAFQLGRSSVDLARQAAPTRGVASFPNTAIHDKSSQWTVLRASREEDNVSPGGWFDGIEINPLYLLPYIGFLAFAFHATSTEAPGASQAIIEQFIADPLHPGVNELFTIVFNLIGLVGIPLACIVMPAAAGQRFPAAPFLVASTFGGYGALGPYVMTRKPMTEVTQSDLGWVTKNVLENKVFNWVVVALAASALVTTGGLPAFWNDPQGQIQGYIELFQQTAIASASSVDFAILCLTAASLIPEDLARRGVTDTNKSRAVAASTLLLPMIGATLYCALRPPLLEEQ